MDCIQAWAVLFLVLPSRMAFTMLFVSLWKGYSAAYGEALTIGRRRDAFNFDSS